jgi:hypothetical protein
VGPTGTICYEAFRFLKDEVNLRLSLDASEAYPLSSHIDSSYVYVHPFLGNDIGLYSTSLNLWYTLDFSGVQQFSLSPLTDGSQNYDIYLYNSGDVIPPCSGLSGTPVLNMDFTAWIGDTTPPARTYKDGIPCKSGDPERRLVAVIRTTVPGFSTVRLGGILGTGTSNNYPRIFLGNLYNQYQARAIYNFGTGWIAAGSAVENWQVPPPATYPVTPRIAWVQARDTIFSSTYQIYNNPTNSSVTNLYVSIALDNTTSIIVDAFTPECASVNEPFLSNTVSSSYSSSVLQVFQLLGVGAGSLVNAHTGNGFLAVVLV